MSRNSLNVLALTDSTGYGKIKGKKTQFVHDPEQGIFHVISPGAALSVGGGKNRLPLARALIKALEENADLEKALSQNLKMEVIFINAKDSVKAKTKYIRMEAYRDDMNLRETDFTIMSLESQVFSNRILELIGVGMFLFCFLCYVLFFGRIVFVSCWCFF